MKEFGNYELKEFSKIRQALTEVYEITTKRTSMVGLVELDVDKARKRIKQYEKQTGSRLSFTGWIIKCIAQAVSEHKEVHAFRTKKNKLIIFDNAHVRTMVERTTRSGKKVPINYLIKFANTKTVQEITNEIREAQEIEVEEGNQLVEGTPKFFMKIYSLIPKFARKIVVKRKLTNTKFFLENAGTIGVTALGMFGKNIAGWGIPFPSNTMNIAIGGIKNKPVISAGKMVEHEFLNLTIQIDHNIVDGGPATRFVARLAELIEQAYGLEK